MIPPEDSPAPLLVLGCHRSGTSAVTGLLHRAAGLHLGDVMPATEANPLGYFESPSIVLGHNRILSELDRDWTCPPPHFDPDGVSRTILEDEIALLRQVDEPWGVKDPRLLFTLPAWLDAVPKFRFLGVIRTPADVVRSITRRDGIPEEAAGRIVEIHVERLAELHRKLGFPLVDFSASPADVVDQVRNVATAMGLDWDEREANAFLRPSLIHHRSAYRDPNADHRYLSDRVARWGDEITTHTAAEVRAALDNISAGTTLDVALNLGPRFSERRRELWGQIDQDEDIDRVVELVPANTPPRKILPRDVDYELARYRSPLDAGRKLSRLPAGSHLLAAGLLEATPPDGLLRLLRDMSRYTLSFATAALDGFVASEDSEKVVWGRGAFETSAAGPLYHHSVKALEDAAAKTGWRVDLAQLDGRGRTTLTLFKDPDLSLSSLPDGGQTALLSLEARVANLERQVLRATLESPRRTPTSPPPKSTPAETSQLEGELDRTKAQLERTKDQLDRLLNRRVVRIGLRLAEMFKPLVRLVKR